MGKEIFVPFAIVATVATMLVPLPEAILNFLLVINFTLAILLLISGLYITEPLKLSVLPTLLLLTTLYRLALNIATTRMILSTGSAGEVVEAFGKVVIQGNVIVGFVVFLIIALVQFIVVAKGAERVAEVSARFTLDALPGKQMSIDADVRAGLLDGETARRKRDELQSESRFYGSLDGAMKFVKGDAVAGLIITAINIVGGLIMGIGVQELDIATAFQKYTILTVGDGLLSQIPALLNATAAGIIVTRVTTSTESSVSQDLMSQLTAMKSVQFLTAIVGLIIACLPGLPALPFLCMSAILCGFAITRPKEIPKLGPTVSFQPRIVPPLEVLLSREDLSKLQQQNDLIPLLDTFRQKIHDEYGLLLVRPCFTASDTSPGSFSVKIRGIETEKNTDIRNVSLEVILRELEKLIATQAIQLIDDSMTRRLLDALDSEAPELVSAVVPGVITVTQLTIILKALLREDISVRHFDLILQGVAESGPKASSERVLLEEIRISMRRVISAKFVNNRAVSGFTLDPVLDVLLAESEREVKEIDPRHMLLLIQRIRELEIGESDIIVTSRGARRLLFECLATKGTRVRVLAFEEIAEGVKFESKGEISLPSETVEQVLMELAA